MRVYFTNELITFRGEKCHIPYTIDEDGDVHLITGEKCYEIDFLNVSQLVGKNFNLRSHEYFSTEQGIKFMRESTFIEKIFKTDYDKIMSYNQAKSIDNYEYTPIKNKNNRIYQQYQYTNDMISLLNQAKKDRKKQLLEFED